MSKLGGLTYGHFTLTGIQDATNVYEPDDFVDEWREDRGASARQIVDRVWARWEAAGMRDQWIVDNADLFEDLDPEKCYAAWASGWKKTAESAVQDMMDAARADVEQWYLAQLDPSSGNIEAWVDRFDTEDEAEQAAVRAFKSARRPGQESDLGHGLAFKVFPGDGSGPWFKATVGWPDNRAQTPPVDFDVALTMYGNGLRWERDPDNHGGKVANTTNLSAADRRRMVLYFRSIGIDASESESEDGQHWIWAMDSREENHRSRTMKLNPSQRALITNPAWVTKALSQSYSGLEDKIPANWLPKLADVRSEKGAKLTAKLKEYGCGAYGCVLPTLDEKVVLKVTIDDTEADFAARLAETLVVPVTCAYYKVVSLPAKRKGSRIFLLWREEAKKVDQIDKEPYGKAAVTAISVQHRAAQTVFDLVDKTGGNPRLPAALKKWVSACEAMGKVSQLKYLSDGMLRVYREQGIFFGDIHEGNVGLCVRDGKQQWVITDPGHVAVFGGKEERSNPSRNPAMTPREATTEFYQLLRDPADGAIDVAQDLVLEYGLHLDELSENERHRSRPSKYAKALLGPNQEPVQFIAGGIFILSPNSASRRMSDPGQTDVSWTITSPEHGRSHIHVLLELWFDGWQWVHRLGMARQEPPNWARQIAVLSAWHVVHIFRARLASLAERGGAMKLGSEMTAGIMRAAREDVIRAFGPSDGEWLLGGKSGFQKRWPELHAAIAQPHVDQTAPE